MSAVEFDIKRLSKICSSRPVDGGGIGALAEELAGALPGLTFEHVLTRSGWHRLGGVVDGDYRRVADHIDQWAEEESGGDVSLLLQRFGDAGYFATRMQGQTHYLVAATGNAPEQFVQLEVEELQETLDRYLIDPDWMPDDLQEFIDPMDYPRVEPEPIAAPRYVFRRFTRVADLLKRSDESAGFDPLRRFMDDWQNSSAGTDRAFCRHWVLSLRETPSRDGSVLVSAKPIAAAPAAALPLLTEAESAQGAEMAGHLRAFDHAAGYPFAWYFYMVATRLVPSALGDAVLRDIAGEYEYLPEKDRECLRAWVGKPYGV